MQTLSFNSIQHQQLIQILQTKEVKKLIPEDYPLWHRCSGFFRALFQPSSHFKSLTKKEMHSLNMTQVNELTEDQFLSLSLEYLSLDQLKKMGYLQLNWIIQAQKIALISHKLSIQKIFYLLHQSASKKSLSSSRTETDKAKDNPLKANDEEKWQQKWAQELLIDLKPKQLEKLLKLAHSLQAFTVLEKIEKIALQLPSSLVFSYWDHYFNLSAHPFTQQLLFKLLTDHPSKTILWNRLSLAHLKHIVKIQAADFPARAFASFMQLDHLVELIEESVHQVDLCLQLIAIKIFNLLEEKKILKLFPKLFTAQATLFILYQVTNSHKKMQLIQTLTAEQLKNLLENLPDFLEEQDRQLVTVIFNSYHSIFNLTGLLYHLKNPLYFLEITSPFSLERFKILLGLVGLDCETEADNKKLEPLGPKELTFQRELKNALLDYSANHPKPALNILLALELFSQSEGNFRYVSDPQYRLMHISHSLSPEVIYEIAQQVTDPSFDFVKQTLTTLLASSSEVWLDQVRAFLAVITLAKEEVLALIAHFMHKEQKLELCLRFSQIFILYFAAGHYEDFLHALNRYLYAHQLLRIEIMPYLMKDLFLINQTKASANLKEFILVLLKQNFPLSDILPLFLSANSSFSVEGMEELKLFFNQPQLKEVVLDFDRIVQSITQQLDSIKLMEDQANQTDHPQAKQEKALALWSEFYAVYLPLDWAFTLLPFISQLAKESWPSSSLLQLTWQLFSPSERLEKEWIETKFSLLLEPYQLLKKKVLSLLEQLPHSTSLFNQAIDTFRQKHESLIKEDLWSFLAEKGVQLENNQAIYQGTTYLTDLSLFYTRSQLSTVGEVIALGYYYPGQSITALLVQLKNSLR